jgi:hypothetical protein
MVVDVRVKQPMLLTFFPRKVASVDITQLKISTWHLCVLHNLVNFISIGTPPFLLVEYGSAQYPKVEGVALCVKDNSFCHNYHSPNATGEICQSLYYEIAALSHSL